MTSDHFPRKKSNTQVTRASSCRGSRCVLTRFGFCVPHFFFYCWNRGFNSLVFYAVKSSHAPTLLASQASNDHGNLNSVLSLWCSFSVVSSMYSNFFNVRTSEELYKKFSKDSELRGGGSAERDGFFSELLVNDEVAIFQMFGWLVYILMGIWRNCKSNCLLLFLLLFNTVYRILLCKKSIPA